MSPFRNKTLQIIRTYLIGIGLLACYYYIQYSSSFPAFFQMVDRSGTPGHQLAFYGIIGLLKYSLLITGIATIVIMTLMLIVRLRKQ